jgi:membrane associated rhomboid family serine protease
MRTQQSPLDSILKFFRNRSTLSTLIIINVVVFIIVNVINLFLWLFTVNPDMPTIAGANKITYWLAVPSHLGELIRKPWTLFTYMFVQEGFFHLFFNMIVLYFGGRIFVEYLDDKKLANTYIWGGLMGALFYIAAFNIFPVFSESVYYSVALGASASVLAVLIAAATYVPDYTVYLLFLGKVKLKYVAIFFVVLDVLSINRGNPGGHIAHLGGAVWGYLSIILLKRGFENPLGINWYGIKKIGAWFMERPKRTRFKDVHFNTERRMTDEEYNRERAEKQKKIDAILDKISRSGYESLSKEEKELLFKASNKN